MTKLKSGILAVAATLGGAVAGAAYSKVTESKNTEKQRVRADRNRNILQMLFKWIEIKQQGKSFESYFEAHGYKSIAIYGIGDVGSRFYEEMKNSNIEVKYAIDKKAGSVLVDLEVFSLEDKLPEVDVIVVTPFNFYDEIEGDLMEVSEADIVSIEDIIYEI